MASSSPSCNELAGRSNLASIADSPRYCYKLNNTRFAEFQHLPCEDYYVVSTLSSHPGGYKLCYIFDGGNCRPSEWIHCADAPPAQPMPAPLPPPLLPSPTPLPPARSPSTLQLPPSPPATPISSSALAPSPQATTTEADEVTGATDEEPPKLGRQNASLTSALAAVGHQNGGCGKGCIAAIFGVLGTVLCAVFIVIIVFARRHQGILKRHLVPRLPGSSTSYAVSIHGWLTTRDHPSTGSRPRPAASPLLAHFEGTRE